MQSILFRLACLGIYQVKKPLLKPSKPIYSRRSQMFIDGKWTNAHNQETFASYNPANAELLGQVPSGGKDDALAAIDSASKAFLLGPR